MQFLIPSPDLIPHDLAARAFLASAEGVPWRCFNHIVDGRLVIRRDTDEPARLHAPWDSGNGQWFLSTCTLSDGASPHNLSVELARGTVYRMLQQVEEWRAATFNLPPELRQRLTTITHTLAQAVISQHHPEQANELASRVIAECLEWINGAADAFVSEISRRQAQQRRPVLLACGVPPEQLDASFASLPQAFVAAALPLNWRQVEKTDGQRDWEVTEQQLQWCKQHDLRSIGGPLFCADANTIPDWMFLWDGNFGHMVNYVRHFVKTAVDQFKGRIQLWHCATAVAKPILKLSDEDQLRMVAIALEALRESDDRTPAIVSFDQPWGESLSERECDLAPIQMADMLARSELGMSAVGLEINFGYWPGGTPFRDLLQLMRQIDQWTLLGLPIVVFISLPSDMDCHSATGSRQARPYGMGPDAPNPQWQAQELRRMVSVLLSKRAVQGVVWKQWRDRPSQSFPYSGLVDETGRIKPSMQVMSDLRASFLPTEK
ncbi:MAG: hypothetical protein R3E01_17405 [Pirellulaceae bacterium]|nr:hypothetical protein [Planctomycetales bacterium]